MWVSEEERDKIISKETVEERHKSKMAVICRGVGGWYRNFGETGTQRSDSEVETLGYDGYLCEQFLFYGNCRTLIICGHCVIKSVALPTL